MRAGSSASSASASGSSASAAAQQRRSARAAGRAPRSWSGRVRPAARRRPDPRRRPPRPALPRRPAGARPAAGPPALRRRARPLPGAPGTQTKAAPVASASSTAAVSPPGTTARRSPTRTTAPSARGASPCSPSLSAASAAGSSPGAVKMTSAPALAKPGEFQAEIAMTLVPAAAALRSRRKMIGDSSSGSRPTRTTVDADERSAYVIPSPLPATLAAGSPAPRRTADGRGSRCRRCAAPRGRTSRTRRRPHGCAGRRAARQHVSGRPSAPAATPDGLRPRGGAQLAVLTHHRHGPAIDPQIREGEAALVAVPVLVDLGSSPASRRMITLRRVSVRSAQPLAQCSQIVGSRPGQTDARGSGSRRW